jgi:hypothetical protein
MLYLPPWSWCLYPWVLVCRSIPWLAAAAMDVWDVGERGNEMGWPMLGSRSRRLLVTDKVMIE